MPSETVQVEFTLTPSDLRAFQWSRSWGVFLRLPLWIAFAVLLVFLFNLYQDSVWTWLLSRGLSVDLAAIILNWTPFLIFFVAVLALLFFRRRKARGGMTRPAYLAQRVVVSPDGLHVARDGMTGDVAWRRVMKIRCRKNYTDIYLDDQQAYLIPARAFPSNQDFDAFNQTAQRYFQAAHSVAG